MGQTTQQPEGTQMHQPCGGRIEEGGSGGAIKGPTKSYQHFYIKNYAKTWGFFIESFRMHTYWGRNEIFLRVKSRTSKTFYNVPNQFSTKTSTPTSLFSTFLLRSRLWLPLITGRIISISQRCLFKPVTDPSSPLLVPPPPASELLSFSQLIIWAIILSFSLS